MLTRKRLQILLWICTLTLMACKKNSQIVRPPISEAPRVVHQGPATELENQTTSNPIMVETLPEPPSTTTEVKPRIPLPATKPPNTRPSRASSEPKREIKASASNEARPSSLSPGLSIQLAPQISENEKVTLNKKITDELDSARSRIRSINKNQLSNEQKTNLTAIQDFIRKSEDAMKRGEYYQSLVLAQKASTLAASIPTVP